MPAKQRGIRHRQGKRLGSPLLRVSKARRPPLNLLPATEPGRVLPPPEHGKVSLLVASAWIKRRPRASGASRERSRWRRAATMQSLEAVLHGWEKEEHRFLTLDAAANRREYRESKRRVAAVPCSVCAEAEFDG